MPAGPELNPTFDAERYERQLKRFAPADRRYVILFTPRSGSTWLTEVLRATGLHGWPQEYLKESRHAELARVLNAKDKASLLEMLARKRKTPNGVFGLKVTSTHIAAFGEQAFFVFFDAETFLYLVWRRNIVAQGISLYRAVETRRFHSSHDRTDHVPAYDEAKIAYWIEHVLEIENRNCLLLSRQSRTPRIVAYEDLCGGRDQAIELFRPVLPMADSLPPPPDVADLTKIGDAWNLEAEERFRAARPDLVAAIEARRLTPALSAASRDPS